MILLLTVAACGSHPRTHALAVSDIDAPVLVEPDDVTLRVQAECRGVVQARETPTSVSLELQAASQNEMCGAFTRSETTLTLKQPLGSRPIEVWNDGEATLTVLRLNALPTPDPALARPVGPAEWTGLNGDSMSEDNGLPHFPACATQHYRLADGVEVTVMFTIGAWNWSRWRPGWGHASIFTASTRPYAAISDVKYDNAPFTMTVATALPKTGPARAASTPTLDHVTIAVPDGARDVDTTVLEALARSFRPVPVPVAGHG